MPRGRPTTDPKSQLIAVRLPPRHLKLLKRRAKLDGVNFSEALRRFLDEVVEREDRASQKKKKASED